MTLTARIYCTARPCVDEELVTIGKSSRELRVGLVSKSRLEPTRTSTSSASSTTSAMSSSSSSSALDVVEINKSLSRRYLLLLDVTTGKASRDYDVTESRLVSTLRSGKVKR
jgi:hypothetical protein